MEQNKWLGYHFLGQDSRLQFKPRRLVKVGQTLKVKPPISLCCYGLHASKRATDALGYAPGPIICRVRLSGEIQEGSDKACATERSVLAMADASDVLHEFACWCAEEALLKRKDAGEETDPRSWAAIEMKRKWLRGEATDAELAAACAAAWAAAWAAARAADRAAAWAADSAAAWAADSAAASAATRAAACAAARAADSAAAWAADSAADSAAAWAAAWAAASAATSAAAWAAASAATRAATRAAAWEVQNAELERRLLSLLGCE